MSDPTSKDELTKKRIISHMNADHSDSVARYIEHHHRVSRWTSRHARLTDITLGALTISTTSAAGGPAARQYTVPLTPPLGTLGEARARLIALDGAAQRALRRSDVTVKTYRAPRGWHAAVFATCLATYALLGRAGNVRPGSVVYDGMLWRVPGVAGFVERVRVFVLWPMVAIHLVEAWVMTERLRRHSVVLGGWVWWAWVVSAFVEGWGSFQRIDAIVEEQRVAKEKAKH